MKIRSKLSQPAPTPPHVPEALTEVDIELDLQALEEPTPSYGYPEPLVSIDRPRELARCLDPHYFMQTYCKVEATTMEAREAQAQVVNGLQECRRIIVKHPRQAGLTTAAVAFALWKLLFQSYQTVLYAAPAQAQVHGAQRALLDMFEQLPAWLKPKAIYSNSHLVQLANGSKVYFSAITPRLGHGITSDLLILDGFAQADPETQERVWCAVAPLISGSNQLLVASTPGERDDLFSRAWATAEAGHPFLHAVSISYWQLPFASPEHAERQLSLMGEAAFRREFLAELAG